MFVRSRKNLHTCKLPLAGSRSPLVKYARGSHIGFRSTSQTRSCALRMPRYVTFTLLPDLGITQRTARSRSFESATSSERNALGNIVVLGRVSGPTLTTVAVVSFRCRGSPAVNTALALRKYSIRKYGIRKYSIGALSSEEALLLLALDEHPLRGEVSRQQGPNGGCTHP